MNDHRIESRKKLVAFTPVYDLLHKKLLGYVGDLTLQGVMVIGEKPVEVGKHLTLGIEFPASDSEKLTVSVAFSSRAAWCRQEETSQYFNLGFEFIEVAPENAKIIEAILDRFQFRHVMNVSDLKS